MPVSYRDPLAQDEDLTHFTNRQTELHLFENLIENETSRPVIAFHGAAGQGKSWLLTRLRSSAQNRGIPTARVTFDPAYGGDKFRIDFAHVLHAIRTQIGVDCPKFEIGYAMYRYKSEGALRPELRGEGWLAGAFAMTTKLAECGLAALSPGLVQQGAALEAWLLEKLGALAAEELRTSAVGRWVLDQAGFKDYVTLFANEAQPILRELPKRLAGDLELNLPANPNARAGTVLGAWAGCRAVVFFDGCEWITDDSWLRSFCAQSMPVQFVLAGQSPLRWLDSYWSQPSKLSQYHIGGLLERDARDYLSVRGLTDKDLQTSILATCRETDGRTFHSLSLGWCADTITLELTQKPAPVSFELPAGDLDALAERFLRAMPDTERSWIESLALSPRFDEAAARRQYSNSWSREQNIAWEKLVGWSIVAPVSNGWYTIRPLARRAITDTCVAERTGRIRNERQRWQSYWKERSKKLGDDAAELEWVQSWFLDPKNALEKWLAMIGRPEERFNASLSRQFLKWWDGTDVEIKPPVDRTHVLALLEIGKSYSQIRELDDATVDEGENLRRAITCFQSGLTFTENPLSTIWAETHFELGRAYMALRDGTREQNLHLSIEHLQSALLVYEQDPDPSYFARTKNALSWAYSNLREGDRKANLQLAIDSCESAIGRLGNDSLKPAGFLAGLKHDLARACFLYARCEPCEGARYLRRAIDLIESTLSLRPRHISQRLILRMHVLLAEILVFSEDKDVRARGRTIQCCEFVISAIGRITPEQKLLFAIFGTNAFDRGNIEFEFLVRVGQVYRDLAQSGAPGLKNAIDDYQVAVDALAKLMSAETLAQINSLLGLIHFFGADMDRNESIRRAVFRYESALSFFTERDRPKDWAFVMHDLGNAYSDLRENDFDGLERAIECYTSALRVITEESYPRQFAITQTCLGNAYCLLSGDLATNLRRGISCYELALRVCTRERFPEEYANAQFNMGKSFEQLLRCEDISDEACKENLHHAIACYKSALEVFTESHLPDLWARTLINLGNAHQELERLGETGHVRQAIDCFEATLRVRTELAAPRKWAYTQLKIACAYTRHSDVDRLPNLRIAMERFNAALRFYSEDTEPEQWAWIQQSIGQVYLELANLEEGKMNNLLKAIACFDSAVPIYRHRAKEEAIEYLQQLHDEAVGQLNGSRQGRDI